MDYRSMELQIERMKEELRKIGAKMKESIVEYEITHGESDELDEVWSLANKVEDMGC